MSKIKFDLETKFKACKEYKKGKALAEYKTARSEAQEYATIKQNVDTLLSIPKEQAKEKSKIL